MSMEQKLDPTLATYNRVVESYYKTNDNPLYWGDEFLVFNKLVCGKKVIDLGCGVGRDAKFFLRHHYNYLGIDASKGMLGVAKKQVPKAKFKLMSYYSLTFAPRTFDGFWAVASLLHVPKRRVGKVLQSLRTILKDDGVGFISLKKKTSVDEAVVKEGWYGGSERFFAYYTKKEFTRMLEKNGFRVLKAYQKKRPKDARVQWLCYFAKKA